jgi:hypothetical protein
MSVLPKGAGLTNKELFNNWGLSNKQIGNAFGHNWYAKVIATLKEGDTERLN